MNEEREYSLRDFCDLLICLSVEGAAIKHFHSEMPFNESKHSLHRLTYSSQCHGNDTQRHCTISHHPEFLASGRAL